MVVFEHIIITFKKLETIWIEVKFSFDDFDDSGMITFITKTHPCNIQQFFTAVKMTNFS